MMQRFKLGGLADWTPVIDLYEQAIAPASGVTRVSFEVLGVNVRVQAFTELGTFPVALGDGLLDVDFSVEGPVTVRIECDGGAVRFRHAVCLVPEHHGETFTTLEPRGRGPSVQMQELWERSQRNAVKRAAMLLGASGKV